MPQILIDRVDSASVQGEGSYVLLKKMTHGEVKTFNRAMAAAAKSEDETPLQIIIRTQVMEWNWSDAEGVAFPLPKDEPEILERLTEAELLFLTQSIMGVSSAKSKN